MVYEAATCGIMLAALSLLFVYVVQLGRAASVRTTIDVYDAATTAPARYLLTKRDASPDALAAWRASHGAVYSCSEPCRDPSKAEQIISFSQPGQVTTRPSATSDNTLNSTSVVDVFGGPGSALCSRCMLDAQAAITNGSSLVDGPVAGEAYRWQLPAAQPRGFDIVAGMFSDARHMHRVFITYAMLQSVAMCMLMVRLLSHVCFQPRLAVLAKTLFSASGDIAHFCVGLAIWIIMVGGVYILLVGDQHPDLNDFGSTTEVLLRTLVAKDDNILDVLRPAVMKVAKEGNTAARVCMWCVGDALCLCS